MWFPLVYILESVQNFERNGKWVLTLLCPPTLKWFSPPMIRNVCAIFEIREYQKCVWERESKSILGF